MKIRDMLSLMRLPCALLMGGFASSAMAAGSCAPNAKVAPPLQNVQEGVTVTLNASPSQPTGISYLWSQVSGPAITFSNTTVVKPTFVAPNVGVGGATVVVQLTVTGCSPAASDSTTTTINIADVAPLNYPPVASGLVSPASAFEGATVTLDGSASSDPDSDPLSYVWTQIGGTPVTLTNANTAVATFTAPNTAYPSGDSLTFKLTVSDGLLSDSTDKIANIVWVDDPPTAALDCPTSVNEGQTITLNGTGSSDPDDGIQTYAWQQILGPPNIDLSGYSANSISFPAPQLGLGNLGELRFQLKVTDFGGQESSADCTLMVNDVTPPSIIGATDTSAEATSAAGATVFFTVSAYDNVDGPFPATCAPASGSTFALGNTAVNCSAQDSAGNSASASFTVSVVDTTAPVIDAHGDEVAEATGPTGAVVTYASPATSDAVDGAGTATCAPASGSTFALGSTIVNCNASDTAGNAATPTSFSVTVSDTIAPVVTPPANSSFEATGPLTPLTSADYGTATSTDAVGVVFESNDAPAAFPLGVTTITWYARDAANNSSEATSTVTVVDTTAPVIAAHGNVGPIEATSAAGAVATYASPATSDAVDGVGTATCAPVSGSTFALGVSTVTCNASDAAGNVSVPTTFNVTVVDTTAPIISAHADVTAFATSASGAVVTYTLPTATDLVDGSVPVNCLPASGSSFAIGSTTVNCSATDSHGNIATSSFTVTVSYSFNGFFKPVDNLPVINVVKAGSAIPVKFSLGGNLGLSIMAAGYPKSAAMVCQGGVQDVVEETVTAGGSSLSYDPTTGQYIYVWKSEKSWAGTCRQLQVKLADGSLHVANFNFSR